MPKLALVQMTATDDLDQNIARMESWIGEAAAAGARAIVFPELAYLAGSSERYLPEVTKYAEVVAKFCQIARAKKLYVIPGSLREPVKGKSDRFFNTLPVISPEGKVLGEYRKIFLFRASLSDRSYDETQYCDAGGAVTTVETSFGTLGLSICFDLRFPELFRALKKRGAQIVLLPAAFTVPTGRVHWHPLLTARAIENQCFVIAPGTVGRAGDGAGKFGHSLAISPWGEILVDMKEKEGLALVDVELDLIAEAGKRLDVWGSRRDELFP